MTSIRSRGVVVRNDLDALSTPPVYCYFGQQTEVAEFCRRTFLMSPLRAAFTPDQIDGERPTFIYVRNHINPVPDEWWYYLAGVNARYAELADTSDKAL